MPTSSAPQFNPLPAQTQRMLTYTLRKSEIDSAHKDKKKRFPEDLAVKLFFTPADGARVSRYSSLVWHDVFKEVVRPRNGCIGISGVAGHRM
jgi:hypothetical protein